MTPVISSSAVRPSRTLTTTLSGSSGAAAAPSPARARLRRRRVPSVLVTRESPILVVVGLGVVVGVVSGVAGRTRLRRLRRACAGDGRRGCACGAAPTGRLTGVATDGSRSGSSPSLDDACSSRGSGGSNVVSGAWNMSPAATGGPAGRPAERRRGRAAEDDVGLRGVRCCGSFGGGGGFPRDRVDVGVEHLLSFARQRGIREDELSILCRTVGV